MDVGPKLTGAGLFSGTERFQVIEELGAGSMCIVYRVRDGQHGEVVALKTLRHLDPSSIYRLKQEFRALSQFDHPNLVSFYELVHTHEGWFVSMELVEGCDFLTFVRGEEAGKMSKARTQSTWKSATASHFFQSAPSGPSVRAEVVHQYKPLADGRLPDVIYLRSCLRQLSEGVHRLHEADRVHRDLKPSNVLVTGAGRVVILDFGLVAEIDQDYTEGTLQQNIAGSAAYMSPEQSVGQPLSPASDWYSVGVMLYEALTGVWPFTGHLYAILTAKQEHDPTPPSVLVPGVPKDLDELCMALLARRPEDRPRGDEVLARLRLRQMPAAGRIVPLKGGIRFRDRQMNALSKSFESVRSGRTVIHLVGGVAGVGKSALVREFVKEVRRNDAVITLKGACFEWESMSYKAVDGIMDNLSRVLRRLSHKKVRELGSRDVAHLAEHFPVLNRVDPLDLESFDTSRISDADRLPAAFRGFTALMTFLARKDPVVLHIDDVQWGDQESAVFLGSFLQGAKHLPLLVLLSARTEVPSVFLDTLIPMLRDADCDVREVVLEALSPEQTVEVAAGLMGADPADRAVLDVSRTSAGNPGHLGTLIRQQNDAVSREAALGVDLNEVMVAQIQRLEGPPLRLLTVLTVAGGPLATEHAIAASELGEEAFAAITTLRAHELIRVYGLEGSDTLDVSGERLRQYLDDQLQEELRAHAHRSIAQILELTGRFDPHALVNHWLGAGNVKKASLVAWLSGERAMKEGDYRRGAPLLALALRVGKWSIRERQSMLLQLGYANAMIGRGLQAAGFYADAVGAAPRARVASIETRQAEQLITAGYLSQGTTILDRLLKAAGQTATSGGLFRGQRDRWRRFKLWRRGLAFEGRGHVDVDADEVAKVDLCWTTVNVIELADPVRAMANQSGHLLIALDVGENEGVLKAMATELYHQALSDPAGAWIEMHDKGMELSRKLGSYPGMGRLTVAAGRAHFEAGAFVEAHRGCVDGDAILANNNIGVAWERFRAMLCAARAQLRLGDRRAAADLGVPLLQQSLLAENVLFQLELLATVQPWMHVADGTLDAGLTRLAETLARWPQEGFALPHAHALSGRAFMYLAADRPDDAWGSITKRWPQLEASGLLSLPSVRADAWLSRARAALAWAAEGDVRALADAEAAIGVLTRDAQPWTAPWIQLCEAGIRTVRGADPADSLAKAAEGFESGGMRLGLAAARLRAGESDPYPAAQGFVRADSLLLGLAPGRW